MDPVSKFNLTVNRELFVIGSSADLEQIKKIFAALPFINCQDFKNWHAQKDQLHFVVATADFRNTKGLQTIATKYTELLAETTHKIIYASAPQELNQEHRLFCVELGTRYVVQGPMRDEDLRAYVKRIAKEANEVGSLSHYEQEIEAAAARRDNGMLDSIFQRLTGLGRDSEEVWRIFAILYRHMRQPKREEHFLKRILALNPQNLWAANCLGRLYLRQKRVAEGIEVLRRMSLFHDLNGERHLELGNAYLHCGELDDAKQSFAIGDNLNAGEEMRFTEGLAKVAFAEGDAPGALNLLKKNTLSQDVISFLNTRAILSIREGRFDDAFSHYDQAVKGCEQDDRLLLARLKFNQGLGYIRANQPEKALIPFEESVALGGYEFRRAKSPLEVTKNIVKSLAKAGAKESGNRTEMPDIEGTQPLNLPMPDSTMPEGGSSLDDIEWETIDP